MHSFSYVVVVLVVSVLCCCKIEAQTPTPPPNWSALTQSQLANLDPSVFTTINSTQLGSIPVASCAGFLPEQIGVCCLLFVVVWWCLVVLGVDADVVVMLKLLMVLFAYSFK